MSQAIGKRCLITRKRKNEQMGLSRLLKFRIDAFSPEDIDRMIRMGWEDRTTFEAIKEQFGFSENEFVRFMRSQLPASAFLRWRKRIHRKGYLKQEKKSGIKQTRFKCPRQTVDGLTK
jgi:uncharacterized protein (TIGR03643 family)